MQTVFSLGDRVRVKETYLGPPEIIGKTATVVDFDGTYASIGLRFDHSTEYFHDCNGACEDDRGWYVGSKHLGHVELLPIKGDDDDDCI